MGRLIDLTGQTFGRLEVIGKAPTSNGGHVRWTCRCQCGVEIETLGMNLRRGDTTSCGCYRTEVHTTHGQAHSKTYQVWAAMKDRCNNPRNAEYVRYGARGIRVCRRWERFENFLADMGEQPPGLTLERRNNDGPYSPRNCEWATWEVQYANRRNNNQHRRSMTTGARK